MQSTAMRAKARDAHGKGQASKLRKQGLIPAVVYGHNKETSMLSINARELERVLKLFGGKGLVDLDIDGTTASADSKKVLIKHVQTDALSGSVVHVDLQEVAMNEKAKMAIPIVITGEDTRKGNAVVQHFLREVHISGFPGDLPTRTLVDASNLQPGDTVRVSDLDLGDKVQIDTPLDEVILSVTLPHVVDEAANEPAGDPVEATSPAVVEGGSEGDPVKGKGAKGE